MNTPNHAFPPPVNNQEGFHHAPEAFPPPVAQPTHPTYLTQPTHPAQPVHPAYPAHSAYLPPSMPPLQPVKLPKPKDSSSRESWFGRNVIGVIAAAMVFLGIIFLGFLVIPAFTDTIKIALMFLFSSVLVVAGVALTYKKKNNFTSALLGCGCGSFYISIMLTHAFFQMIPDIVAFALLLLWLAGALALVKLSDSLLMNIIAHVGMVVSLCFAYSVGLAQDRLLVILVYHVLSVVLIVVGNKLCYQKAFKVGLLASLFMSLVAVFTMYSFYNESSVLEDPAQMGIAAVAFLIQLVGALLLSGAIAFATIREKESTVHVCLHMFNTVVLFGIIFVSTYLFPLSITSLAFAAEGFWHFFMIPTYEAAIIAVGVSVLVAIAYIFSCLFIQRKLQASAPYELFSVIMACVYIAVLLVGVYFLASLRISQPPHLPGLILVAAIVAACFHLTKNKVYFWFGLSVLALDFVMMVLGGYDALVESGTVILGFVYMALCLALLGYFWLKFDAEKKSKYLVAFRAAVLVVFEVSILKIMFASNANEAFSLIAVTGGFLVLFALKFDARDKKQGGFWMFMRVNELVLVAINSAYIAFSVPQELNLLLCAILAIASIALLVCTTYCVSRAVKFPWLGVFLGICFTFAVLAPIKGMTSWFEEPYVFSLVLMISALICISCGFATKMKPLRLYGLVVIIACVLKLVTIDIANAETLMRVVVFIGGGFICFGISALYTYSVKRFDAEKPVPAYAPPFDSEPYTGNV